MHIINSYQRAVALFLTLAAVISGCGSGGGKDTILSYAQPGYSTSSTCLICHSSHNSASLDPLITNGSGTAGKHALHVTDRGIECLTCHFTYISESTHMNGTLDTINPSGRLVSFDSLNPSGQWINDTGPQTGSCSNLACHGPQTPDWYGLVSTLPDCSVCHTGPLDPATTNGSGTDGKHVIHVTNRDIPCLTCHTTYTNQMTHMNGTKDTVNPAVQLVFFDATNPVGAWTNDTGPSTGACSSLACHGPQTPDWYGASSQLPDCSVCHTGLLDPLFTNATGTYGKHTLHVSTKGIGCAKCHQDYTNQGTHMNGTKDTPNPSVRLVSFDATNPTGTWIHDTGPSTGACSSLACHGAQTPDWYGAGSNMPDCSVCHAGAFNPVTMDALRGSIGHQRHYVAGQIACLKCHANYTGHSTHMNGVLDASSLSGIPLIYFDSTNATGQWVNPGTCANTYCHSNGTSVSTGVLAGNSSPAWFGTTSSSCTSCHGNTMYSDWRAAGPLYTHTQPKANSHMLHMVFTCNNCHFTTTNNGTSISNPATHANGAYNVDPDYSATYTVMDNTVPVGFSYSYDPGGGVCSGVSCHALRGQPATIRWGR